MEFSQFHFADPMWFWGVIVIPIVGLLYLFVYRSNTNIDKLENFVDKHLIPHLLQNSRTGNISLIRSVLLGSILWLFLMAAMACPRWNFKEIENLTEDKTLLILLDLSKSMDSDDIKPSRLMRARQEIEDILNLNKGVRIGLIGFAANAHIISTITDDMSNIKHLLPVLGTDLVYVQGTRLFAALKTADQMLASERGTNKSILIITDGGITDLDSINLVSALAEKNIITHTLGIGTQQGVKLIDETGKFMQRDGQILVSKLDKSKLQDISNAGMGKYFDTHHSDNNTQEILDEINVRNNFLEKDTLSQGGRQWEDEFYIFVFPVMLVILLWFKKGFSFPIILLVLLTHSQSALGVDIIDQMFLSKEQQAKKSLEEIEDFDTAAMLFDDPYKRGVAYYKAGNFVEAEKYFRSNTRQEVQANSLYNLGNALAMQDKLDESIEAYKQALEYDQNNLKAKNNLGIIKFMLVKVEKEKETDKKKKKTQNDDGKLLGGEGGGGSDDNEGEDSTDKNDKDKSDKDKNDKDKSDKDKNDKDKSDKDKSDKDKNDKDKNDKDKSDKDLDPQNKNNSGSGKEIEVDQWLNQIPNDHKNFLKNQFYLESLQQNNQTQSTIDPW